MPSATATRQAQLHALSLESPRSFWAEQARGIDWVQQPTSVYDDTTGVWFGDGLLNTCFNALDRHTLSPEGAARIALIHDSAFTGVRKLSYADLLDHVQIFAGVLARHGVGHGTTVLLYMPMVPEAVIAMLACARLGAISSAVFGGFAANELAKRIEDCKPLVVLAATCGLEPTRVIHYKPLVDSAIAMCTHKPSVKIYLQRPQSVELLSPAARELDWQDEVSHQRAGNYARPGPAPVQSNHPLYLLYTSGSTGTPKGVVRDNGGHAVAVKWATENIFGLQRGDVMFSASDIGWVLGHSFIVYGPLMAGCTTVLYEGKPVGTPDAGAFWRVIAQHNVNVFFGAPTAIRAIKREDPNGLLLRKMPSLRDVFLAGERSDTDTVNHFSKMLGVPVRDNYWQTETGWPITCAMTSKHSESPTPIRVGSAGLAVPGYDVCVLVPNTERKHGDEHDDEHEPSATAAGAAVRRAKPGEMGNLVVKLPLPPGCLLTLWNNPAGFSKSYLEKFPGYFDLTDSGFIDADGYVNVMTRTDDVINTAGHRLTTGSIEQVVAMHGSVAEVAVVGMREKLKGEKPVGFVILKHLGAQPGHQTSHAAIGQELIGMVRSQIGAFACFDLGNVFFVDRLPKTRSGKVLRRTLRAIVNGDSYAVPATIEDASVLGEIERAVGSSRSLQARL
ncbi:hypothetical protein BC831DRAFT_460166 [Entophlyctis helioformis]|nr:hypothetical protein BC831DRAFT_460166 [Entophlyctis helioformis]